jgi:hypothetical protein
MTRLQSAFHGVLAAGAGLVLFLGCSKRLESPPEVKSDQEPGSMELVFWISERKPAPGGGWTFTASGLREGHPLGFDLSLGPWRENPPGYVNLSTYECSATLSSRGAQSDDFLRLLSRHYSLGPTPGAMAQRVECRGLSPWGDPGEFEDGPQSVLMLFSDWAGDTPGQPEGAEVWIEIDLDRACLRWREKDPAFRRRLVEALAEPEE